MTTAVDERRHIPLMERQVCAMTSALEDAENNGITGEVLFTIYEFPCPQCDRMLWGWSKGHQEAPSTTASFICPCGAKGHVDPNLVVNVERLATERK